MAHALTSFGSDPRHTILSDRFREHLIEALGRNYTLDRELTGGGMSRVFVAREHALSRTVVVKVLGPELAADVNGERFRREIMLAAQLQHPLIVPVLSAGEDRELLWYTMPFVEGESLREEIPRGEPASTRNARRVLHDVLDALAYAHARGVIHRDIKPGNILRHGNHSLVTDFGVAKALSASLPSSGTTSAGIAIGTPAYMAPEQLAADPSANHRMDIYAVGLLVYELLTGTQAFAESSPQATMAAQLTRMPRDLAEVRPDVPPQLSSLIMRMLAKNPNDRPQSAATALEELDTIVTPAATTAPLAIGGRRYMRSGPLTIAALSIVVAGLILAVSQRSRSSASRDTTAGVAAVPQPTLPPAPGAATKTLPTQSAPAPATKANTKIVPAAGAGSSKVPDATKATKTAATTKALPPPPGTKTASPGTKTPAPTRPVAVPSLNRRIAVMPIRVNTSRENVAAAVQAIDDSLKKALITAGYTLATDSELLRLVTQQNMVGGGLRRLADAAGMGAVVMIDVVSRGDEVSAITQVLDVWRSQTGSGREAADIDKPMELLSVVRQITRALDRVSWRKRTDPKRVLLFDVGNQTGVDSFAPVARMLEDSLRAAIGRAGAEAMPLDSATRATRDVLERRQLAIRRGAGAIVDAGIFRMRADSALIRMSVRDMSEERTFPNIELRTSLRDVQPAFSLAASRLAEVLAQVNWGPKALPSP